MIKHLRFSQNCNLINIQCNLKWLVMEIHQSAIYTIQITRGIVIYLCFLRGSNLDILPKVGEWAGKVVKWWWFNLCSCHGPHYYIESKVLSGMIYHSIEYRVIPSAFNTQERIQNCKRLVMMHIWKRKLVGTDCGILQHFFLFRLQSLFTNTKFWISELTDPLSGPILCLSTIIEHEGIIW